MVALAKYTNCSLLSWKAYGAMVREWFGDVCIYPMANLMKLRQTSTVEDYYDDFDTIINRLNLSESYTVSCFLGGLKKDIQNVGAYVSIHHCLARFFIGQNV